MKRRFDLSREVDPVKSIAISADASKMPSFLIAAILGETEAWLAMAVIAAWLVVMCLKVIGADLDNAIRWHELKVKAHILRSQHQKRLRELGIKHGRNV